MNIPKCAGGAMPPIYMERNTDPTKAGWTTGTRGPVKSCKPSVFVLLLYTC